MTVENNQANRDELIEEVVALWMIHELVDSLDCDITSIYKYPFFIIIAVTFTIGSSTLQLRLQMIQFIIQLHE